MDEMVERAAATVAEADSVTLTACREGYFPREVEVAGLHADGLTTVWMSVRADAGAVVTLRRGVRAALCIRRGKDSVTLSGQMCSVDDADAAAAGIVAGRGFCAVRFTSESASVWIDDEAAHYDLAGHE